MGYPAPGGGRVPTALGLSRLSGREGLTPGREQLLRHVARLVELDATKEFLMVPAARGESTCFLAELTGAVGSGVDPDQDLVDVAVERARAAGMAARVHFDQGPLTDLPYKDAVFDLAIGGPGIAAASDPAAAIGELARVTKPMGQVVLVLPVWIQRVEERRLEVLVRRLGLQPQLLQQWKQQLRAAGVVSLHVEDLSAAATSAAGVASLPELLHVRDTANVAWRAWKRWRWEGLSAALAREQEVRRLVNRERVLGLSLVKGVRWHDEKDDAGPGQAPAAGA